jgi:FAD/FMN-containing dehydrogenase
MSEFLEQCRTVVGEQNVLTSESDMAGYVTEWRRRLAGRALAVVRPASTDEVAAIVQLCNTHRVPVVPQGGNTGLVLGSVPDDSGTAIVLSLNRMNKVRAVDQINNTITVEAGCILAQVQAVAVECNRLFPLSLAAEGSCTIGGNLSTNAGGTAVLRYGNARDLCLGLEVVTPQGEIWNGLRGLRKDNTGYDLRDLYIGAEGTLGVITAAVMKLFPQPKARLTALAAMQSPAAALTLLSMAQSACGSALTGFELMSRFCLELVARHFPQLPMPFADPYPQYVLLELSDSESEEHAMAMFEALITRALEEDVIQDAVVASSLAQSKSLWNLREHIPMAQMEEGLNIKHDISVPISRIGDFIEQTDRLLQKHYPGTRPVNFGHLGDGNLHYNLSPAVAASDRDFLENVHDVNQLVHDSVHKFGGSISAEHGLGAQKREEIRQYKSPVEMKLMESIKQALDPLNIMNPGKVL